MTERYTLKQNLYTRAAMFTAEEIRRQKRLKLTEINENVLNGLIKQKVHYDMQQQIMVRTLMIALFLMFVAWSGGNIKLPGTGVSIGEVPAFLELSIIVASFSVLMLSYVFLSIQIYSAVISAISKELLAKNELDPDIFVAAKEPTWLFLKYAQTAPVRGREPGFKISCFGKLYNKILIRSLSLILIVTWVFAIACILYIAHTGLKNTVADWSVYLFCCSLIVVSLISMAANFFQFEHEMDFNNLETTQINVADGRGE